MVKRRREPTKGARRGQVAADLHLASRLVDERRFEAALPLLRKALDAQPTTGLRVALGDCLRELGRRSEALAEYERAPGRDPEVARRLGAMLAEAGRFAEALPHLRRVGSRDAAVCSARAYVELQTSNWREAESAAARALELLPAEAAGREDAAFLLAIARTAQGELISAADALRGATSPRARSLAARLHLMGGDLSQAIALYQTLDVDVVLRSEELADAALASAWAGDPERAQLLLARAQQGTPSVGVWMATAQVALARRAPEAAIDALNRMPASFTDAADSALSTVLRARASRQLGRFVAVDALGQISSEVPPRIRALARLEVGHVLADEGRFEEAEHAFADSLSLDPNQAEARRSADLARQRLTWKLELAHSAAREVEAAKAEAEALRHSFAEREREVAALKRQLAALEQARKGAEQTAVEARAEADRISQRVEAERSKSLQQELETREAEVLERTEAELKRSFANRLSEVPPALVEIVRQAERMFQKGLQTDLPGAGVAVLFSGALERALFLSVVAELDRHLDQTKARQAFLDGSRRLDAAGHVTYLDHFVGAFDRDRPLRAPGLGEVSRALHKRREPHLDILRRFLEEGRGWSPEFLDALANYLDRVKSRLRDPVAHGRILEVSEREVTELREALLHRFEDGPGLLARLVFPR